MLMISILGAIKKKSVQCVVQKWNVLTFEIPGVIQPQERPRFSRPGKNVVTHDAPKRKDFKDFVKLVAWQNKPSELITGPIKLKLIFISCHRRNTIHDQKEH